MANAPDGQFCKYQMKQWNVANQTEKQQFFGMLKGEFGRYNQEIGSESSVAEFRLNDLDTM